MTIDERLEVLALSVELLTHDIHEMQSVAKQTTRDIELLLAAAQQDGENIRALARIADIHERRITSLEGGQPG